MFVGVVVFLAHRERNLRKPYSFLGRTQSHIVLIKLLLKMFLYAEILRFLKMN